LEEARQLGVRALRVGDVGFDEVVNAGRVKWVGTEQGELLVVPKWVQGREIAHTVLTGGRPVLAAGEAEIATGGGRRLGIEITNYSGHHLPSGARLQIGRSAFEVAGIVFP
jgi:hypothetical protein